MILIHNQTTCKACLKKNIYIKVSSINLFNESVENYDLTRKRFNRRYIMIVEVWSFKETANTIDHGL